ncbi:MAG: hypothetical protein ABIJ26_04875 [Candidatus Margulisiibacteriota bacterium]|nr:hypothetical protein [Candidatus Margulisiibacteriota bacterium]
MAGKVMQVGLIGCGRWGKILEFFFALHRAFRKDKAKLRPSQKDPQDHRQGDHGMLVYDNDTYYYDLLKTDEFTRLAAHPELFREEVASRDPRLTNICQDPQQPQ